MRRSKIPPQTPDGARTPSPRSDSGLRRTIGLPCTPNYSHLCPLAPARLPESSGSERSSAQDLPRPVRPDSRGTDLPASPVRGAGSGRRLGPGAARLDRTPSLPGSPGTVREPSSKPDERILTWVPAAPPARLGAARLGSRSPPGHGPSPPAAAAAAAGAPAAAPSAAAAAAAAARRLSGAGR